MDDLWAWLVIITVALLAISFVASIVGWFYKQAYKNAKEMCEGYKKVFGSKK